MDLGRRHRLGALRRPRPVHRGAKNSETCDGDGLVGKDGVVLPINDSKDCEEGYSFSRGDILKPKFERECSKMWMVLERYTSVRGMKCVKCIDTMSGDMGYFMEIEMVRVE